MNRNSVVLQSFADYCANHPEERFWQALRNWSRCSYILNSNVPPSVLYKDENPRILVTDTFSWEGRNANNE